MIARRSRTIVHPALVAAFDVDWYYPFAAAREAAKTSRQVRAAFREGWAEWIENDLDLEAVRKGYLFDLSRDKDGRPVYWHAGRWVGRVDGKLVEISEEDVAHCGAGDQKCRVIELYIRHTMEPWDGQPFILLPWQRKLVLTLFGWVHRKTGLRRFRRAYWDVAKKNGKSTLVAALAITLLIADREKKARVYGAASNRAQAREVFNEARDFVKAQPLLAEHIEILESTARLIHWETGSFYTVLSADAYRNESLNAHAVVFDELHVQKNRRMMRVLRRAGRARRQPLMLIITTAGENLDSIWGEERAKAKRP